jgi:hypothetical protein
MIDIPRAFTYVFDDPQWVSKLLMVGIVTFASVLLSPLLIGLAGVAILLGYLVELIGNMRHGERYPLPAWNDFGNLLTVGINPIIAWIAYNLPNGLLIGVTALIAMNSAPDSVLSGGLLTLMTCCFLPLMIVYNIAIQPLFALALGRYSVHRRLDVFFDFNGLIALARARTDLLVQWLLGMVVMFVLMGLINGIPCLGTLASLALTLPIIGHLNGQYAAAALDKPKRA